MDHQSPFPIGRYTDIYSLIGPLPPSHKRIPLLPDFSLLWFYRNTYLIPYFAHNICLLRTEYHYQQCQRKGISHSGSPICYSPHRRQDSNETKLKRAVVQPSSAETEVNSCRCPLPYLSNLPHSNPIVKLDKSSVDISFCHRFFPKIDSASL